MVAHDSIDGINFKSNAINKSYEGTIKGLTQVDFNVKQLSKFIFAPDDGIADIAPFVGFEFDKIDHDLFGNKRSTNNRIGAVVDPDSEVPDILEPSNYGPSWYSSVQEVREPGLHRVAVGEELEKVIADATPGDIIFLDDGEFIIEAPLQINKKIIIRSKSGNTSIKYTGIGTKPLFLLMPKGDLHLDKIDLKGTGNNYCFATLKSGMSAHFNLNIVNSGIRDFDYVLKAYKQSFADSITLVNTLIEDCQNGLELSEETNDRGDYNAEFITITNSEFRNIKANVIDYYRGGYDESTIGGNLVVENSLFINCGGEEANNILLNHRGIINVNLKDNRFENNPVKFVSILWGAKNNVESGNEVINSGELRTEENIQLTLMY